MALSKAAKAALIAGGLYGMYRMLGSKQDGKDVPVEDRNTIRKTIAEADKKQDTKPAAAAAPSVKDKPTVKPAAKKKYTIEPYMDPSTVKPMPMGGGRGKASGATAKDLASMRAPKGPSDADIRRANLMQTAALADVATPARRASMAARRDGTRAMRDAAVKQRARAASAANAMPYMDPSTVVPQRPASSGRGAMAGATAADFAGVRAAEQARGEDILARETRRLALEDRARRGMKKGGSVKKGRGDGMAQRGKTKGRMC
jgi:hypothetical protein